MKKLFFVITVAIFTSILTGCNPPEDPLRPKSYKRPIKGDFVQILYSPNAGHIGKTGQVVRVLGAEVLLYNYRPDYNIIVRFLENGVPQEYGMYDVHVKYVKLQKPEAEEFKVQLWP
jgi:hypothetical protein